MTIEKGSAYGRPAPLPAGGMVVRSDAEGAAALEAARLHDRTFPTLGLLGGDLARTLGAPAESSEERLRSGDAATFAVDLGEVLIDGQLHLFVAHLVTHTPTWSYAFVAMNAQWWGRWNLGPRAHPGDGRIDTYEARLGLSDRFKVRARLHHGAHLPHPAIRERRAAAVQVRLPRALPVILDGRAVGRGRQLSVRVEPDALTVVV